MTSMTIVVELRCDLVISVKLKYYFEMKPLCYTMTGATWTIDIVEEEILMKLVILVSEIKAIYSPPPKCSVRPTILGIILNSSQIEFNWLEVCSGLCWSVKDSQT